ncbi:SulP family inorganic anion transporter, partial [Leptolyngbya cf. ectocarpi LEGE 11479]
LLFRLSGPMIFGVAKAINREHNAIKDCDAVVFDLSDVRHLGVTASLAIENAVKEALDEGRQVFIVGATGQTGRRLRNLKVLSLLPPNHIFESREEALKYAAHAVSPGLAERSEQPPLDYGSTALS